VLGRTAYHAVADGLGALGLVVTDPASLDDALVQALAVARTGRPVVVNVHIGETDFRQGSMSL
jgi:acetolactate synthase-1/2/3 large subunit